MGRPKSLRWIGPVDENGAPVQWVANVSARNLDEADIAELTDKQLAAALASGLYEAPGAKPAKPAAAAADANEE